MAVDYTKRSSSPRPQGGSPTDGVSLNKVTLTKAAPTVSLTKATGGAADVLRVNLNWTAGPPAPASAGFSRRATAAAAPGIDLDLACLYEFTDGSKGIVQALGNAFSVATGFSDGKPVIWLDGDDRSGSNDAGENLFIDLQWVQHIRRVLVFTYIYEGTPNWASANGVVTLFPATGGQIEVRLDESRPSTRSCAIAMLEGNGVDLTVRREVRYINGTQSQVDEAYGWGMKWKRARK